LTQGFGAKKGKRGLMLNRFQNRVFEKHTTTKNGVFEFMKQLFC
jgi:hypothetical protein